VVAADNSPEVAVADILEGAADNTQVVEAVDILAVEDIAVVDTALEEHHRQRTL
jgi:hypothetical protein